MNHLAHALLAAHDDRAIVGALLSDFVKGEGPRAYAPDVRDEIVLHRHVDVFTDSHPAVRGAIARFAPDRRRFAGLALDVHFDHLLASRWAAHGDGGALDDFSRRVCDAIAGFEGGPLPAELALLGERWRRHGGLAGYREADSVGFALDRLATRLSRGRERLRATRADLQALDQPLSEAFESLWPDLRDFVEDTRRRGVPAASVRTAP